MPKSFLKKHKPSIALTHQEVPPWTQIIFPTMTATERNQTFVDVLEHNLLAVADG